MNFDFEYTNFDKLVKNIRKTTVGEASPIVAEAKVAGSCDPEFEGFKFSIKPEMSFRIEALNDDDDKDCDEVYGKKQPGKTFPVLSPGAGDAWLKYRAELGIDVELTTDHSDFEMGLEKNQNIVIADYRHYPPTDDTIDAVKNVLIPTYATDKTRIRTILSKQDLEKLQEKDALVYIVKGSMKGRVKIKFSDVFTGSLNTVMSSLDNLGIVNVETNANAFVGLNSSVSDTFVVVITRADDNTLRVSVKKGKTQSIGASAGAEISVKFQDPDGIAAQISEALLNTLPHGAKDTILNDEKAAASLKKISDEVKEFAEKKLEVAYTCSYKKIKQDETMMQAVISAKDLVRKHEAINNRSPYSSLIRCNLQDLLDLAMNEPDIVTLENYLREIGTTTSLSWGFSLGYGKWKMASNVTKDRTWVKRTIGADGKHEVSVSFDGTVKNTLDWFDETSEWLFDFKADLRSGVTKTTMAEYDYGMDISWKFANEKMTWPDLQECLDFALLCQKFPEDEYDVFTAKYRELLASEKKIEVGVNIRFDHGLLTAMLNQIHDSWKYLAAGALAQGMPFDRTRAERFFPGSREETFLGAWYDYLKRGSMTQRAVDDAGGQTDDRSFGGVMQMYGFSGNSFRKIAATWRDIVDGLTGLRDGIKKSDGIHRLEGYFKDFMLAANQQLYARSFVVFMVKLAALAGEKHLDTTLKIVDVDAEKEYLI